MLRKIKNKIGMWLWAGNPWTICVDQILQAAKDIRKGEVDSVELHWHFSFWPEPNKFRMTIDLQDVNPPAKENLKHRAGRNKTCEHCKHFRPLWRIQVSKNFLN